MKQVHVLNNKIRIMHNFFPANWGKGKVDLLGGIVHKLYTKLVASLLERASDLRLVTREMNSQFSVPGETRSESCLSVRVFFHVSKEDNAAAKSSRTTCPMQKSISIVDEASSL